MQLAEPDDVADIMCRYELQMSEQGREESPSRAKDGDPMEREMSYERLERMSLESLLYHVLVGDGRPGKKPASA